MKKLGMLSVSICLAALGACDKGAKPDAEGAAPATSAVPVAQAEAPSTVAAAKTATPGATDSDCPFHDEKAGAAHDCGSHAAPGAAAVKADEGCAGLPKVAAEATPTPTGEARHFGSVFSLTDATPLSAAVAAGGDGSDAVLQVSGKIEKVCQKKGCWMVVRDGGVEARVVMKGYAFTVPVNSTGSATVEGTLSVRTFTEAQVKHLAEDGGQDPNTVSGERKEFLLTANGIRIES